MKLVSWNVNGLRAAFNKGLTDFIGKVNPDVLCLQETKIQKEQLTEQHINLGCDYMGYFSFAEKKGYSGVATYVKEHCKHQSKYVLNGIKQKIYDSEGRFLIIPFGNFDLYNIYFPSGTTGAVRQEFKYRFLDAFYSYVSELPKSAQERIVLCGDLNICHTEIDIHHPAKATKLELSGFLPEERAWMDSLAKLNLVDAFRHLNPDVKNVYSWWSYRANARAKNLGWRIDYFFLSEKLLKYLRAAEIHTGVTGSDHCPISIDLVF